MRNGTASDEVPSNQNINVVLQDKLIYSNLDSELSMEEVRDILIKAGIQTNQVDTVLSWVTDYNNSMRECPTFTLFGDFITIDEMIVCYGEYPAMSTQWYKRNNQGFRKSIAGIGTSKIACSLIKRASHSKNLRK